MPIRQKLTGRLVTLALAATVLTGIQPPSLRGQDQQKQKPIRAVTPQQKEHSRRHKNFGAHIKLTSTEHEISGAGAYDTYPRGRSAAMYKHPTEFLRELVCESDAVLIGTFTEKTTLLTEGETFIFTDYKVSVEEVLKDNADSPITPGLPIIVTRPGGSLQINGRTVTATLDGFKPTKVGARYLLYLKYIPITDAYQAYGNRTFELRGPRYIKHTPQRLWDQKLYRVESAASFLEHVRSSITGPCSNKSK